MKDNCQSKYRIVYVKDDVWCPEGWDGFYSIEERVRGLFRYRWKTVWLVIGSSNIPDYRIPTEDMARKLLEKYKQPRVSVIYEE